MKVVLFGYSGMVGTYMYKLLSKNHDIICISRCQYDVILHDWNILKNQLLSHDYDVIVNCIGVTPHNTTNNDDYMKYIKINTLFPHKLCEYSCNKPVIHISTNNVFDGNMQNAKEDNTNWSSDDLYAVSKLLGEPKDACCIRASVIGHEHFSKRNFLEWVISNKNLQIDGYSNVMWNGITCLTLAKIVKDVIENNTYWKGIRHIFSDEIVSKFDLCHMINSVYGLNLHINNVMQLQNKNRSVLLSSNYENLFCVGSIESQLKEQYEFSFDTIGSFTQIIDTCKICNSKLDTIFSFKMPLAGGFLKHRSDYIHDKIYPLTFVYCNQCKTGFVKEVVHETQLFSNINGNSYFYYSSTIPKLRLHFKKLAQTILDLNEVQKIQNAKILEIGCNDGVLLNELFNMSESNITLIGIDPSETIESIKNDKIIKYRQPFNNESVKILQKTHSKMDIIVACNCLAHIDKIIDVYSNCKKLLSENGTFIVEVHYFPLILEELQFDFIYHEHMMYYSKTTFNHICKLFNFKIMKFEHIDTHGGSLRVFLKHNNNIHKDICLRGQSSENLLNDRILTFQNDLQVWKQKTIRLLEKYQTLGKKQNLMFAYGASGRTNTILNYLDFRFDFIFDDSPIKHNCYLPKYYTKIINSSMLYENKPEYCFILAYPYKNDIIKKHKKYLEEGGKFVLLLPQHQVISIFDVP